jgi:hypothetical protein
MPPMASAKATSGFKVVSASEQVIAQGWADSRLALIPKRFVPRGTPIQEQNATLYWLFIFNSSGSGQIGVPRGTNAMNSFVFVATKAISQMVVNPLGKPSEFRVFHFSPLLMVAKTSCTF